MEARTEVTDTKEEEVAEPCGGSRSWELGEKTIFEVEIELLNSYFMKGQGAFEGVGVGLGSQSLRPGWLRLWVGVTSTGSEGA